MELRLQKLDHFLADGSDGNTYKVIAYDRLVAVPGAIDQWAPSGQIEYRLPDGRRVDAAPDGTLVVGGGVTLATSAAERTDT